MTRIQLPGKGTPIPTEALPEGLLALEDAPPISIVLDEEEGFHKEDFVGLGYTHYEVYCIGAAGGLGAPNSRNVGWTFNKTTEVMPIDLWNAWLENAVYDANYEWGGQERIWPYDGEGLTFRQLKEAQNPTHTFIIRNYELPYVLPTIPNVGGGGGGGGLHRVSGNLEDLDDVTPIVIGQAGADAVPGQNQVPGEWNPLRPISGADYSYDLFTYPSPRSGYFSDESNIPAWFSNRYPVPSPTLLPPQPGEDGGASSFGDIAQASGGKGGLPTLVWVDNVKFFNAFGGEGGSGGTLVAGGGGAGSTSSDKNGKDGSWDGTIGKGGGGGRGGVYTAAANLLYSVSHAMGYYPIPRYGFQGGDQITEATAGGQGSFNYGDNSVFGQRQFRSGYQAFQNFVYDPNTGQVVHINTRPLPYLITPGGGGGAKAPGKRWHGSRASGYSPNGAVIVKVFKI